MKMREKDRRDFEKAVKSVLTDEQKKKWRKMQREERDKWRHHDMDRLKDKRGEKDQEEGE